MCLGILNSLSLETSWNRKWTCKPLRMATKRKNTKSFLTRTSSPLLFQHFHNRPMFARAFIILAMVGVVSKVQGTAVLRGVVLSNELGGPPVGNVEVSAVAGNPNNTGTDGRFMFTFPNRKPGDTVRLIVRKEGYVVVNDIQLEFTLPADPDERLAIILLCKEGDREEMARRFYKLKSVEAIDETYKKKLEDAQNASAAELAKLRQERDQAKALDETYKKKLEDAQNASAAELAKLHQERDQAKAIDENYKKKLEEAQNASAAELAKLHQERDQAKAIDETYKKKLEEAQNASAVELAKLRQERDQVKAIDENYKKKLEEAQNASAAELAKLRQERDQVKAIDENYKKKLEEAQNASAAELAKLRQERDQAKGATGKVIEGLAKQKPDVGSELYRTTTRLFLDGKVDRALVTLSDEKLRELSKARKEGKVEAEKITEEATRAWLLKAQLLTVQFRFNDAEQAYQGAIETSPGSFGANFAFALFSQQLNHYDKAMSAYGRCLELASRNQDNDKIAMTQTNLAILDAGLNRPEAARKGFEEALKIYRKSAKNDPDTHLPDVAATANNLATLDRDQNRPEAARKRYEEALKIYRQLAQKNPDTYLPYVALTVNNLAALDRDQNRMEEARRGLEEALKIRRGLAQNNPNAYLPKVASTLNNLAMLDRAQNRPEEARKGYEEALKIRRQLAKKNPDAYLPEVAGTLNLLAVLDVDQNRRKEARKGLEEALEIYDRFGKRNPERFQSDVARVKRLLRTLSN